MPAPPEGWRLLGIAQQHSAPAAAAGNQAQRTSWQKEATEPSRFYLFRGKIAQFVQAHGPHGARSISHFYLPHSLLPLEVTVNSVSQRLKLLLWPSTPCIKYVCSRKTGTGTTMATTMAWW